MNYDYPPLSACWDPWARIPKRYNLGVGLTTDQVKQGHGNKIAIYWENAVGDKRCLTYQELDVLSTRLAISLQYRGIQRGDRVLLRLPNIPEFYIAALGIAKLGGVFIPSSTQFRAGEIQYRLNDAGAAAVIVSTHLLDAVEEAASGCGDLKHVIVVPYPDPMGSAAGYDNFSRLVDDDRVRRRSDWTPADTGNDDLAFLAYTSGTTGDPKGVAHLQRYPVAYEGLIRYWHNYRFDDVAACPSEMGWLLPVASTFLYALSHGLTIVLYDAMGKKFDPLKWFDLIQRYRITNFTAPPTVYRLLMTAADRIPQYDLSTWRHGVAAGEPLLDDTFHAFRKHFGITLLDGIGMSECMVYCFNMVGMPVYPGSCGKPGPGTVIELLDDNLDPVPTGNDGVLCVRRDTHPGMLKEYWNKPELTAEIFRGPWYYSGDVLRKDAQGYYWFQGRYDDLIKASGYRVSPFEVESCLCCHPAVLEAAVVGSPDELHGLSVKAFLVLKEGFQESDALVHDIKSFTRTQIAPFKCPRKIEILTSFPKTPSGKVKRWVLRMRELGQTEDKVCLGSSDKV